MTLAYLERLSLWSMLYNMLYNMMLTRYVCLIFNKSISEYILFLMVSFLMVIKTNMLTINHFLKSNFTNNKDTKLWLNLSIYL